MDLSGERYEQETMIEENREKGRDQMEKEKNNEKKEEREEKEINDEKKNEREEEEDERPSSPRPSSPQGRQGIHQEEPSPRGKGPSREDLAPPDGGWGWMVTLGAFVIMNLLPMIPTCFGILFSRFLLDLRTSSTTTAWIFSIFCFVWNFFALICRPLTKEFGWRPIALYGILSTSLALVISAFAPSAEFLLFSFALLAGSGCGMVVCICFCIVPIYFDRRRGQANAIMMAGAGLGQITGPPLIEFLQHELGYKGASLIMGALVLHGCIGASLFHPIAWHQKRIPRKDGVSGVKGDAEAPLLSARGRNSVDVPSIARTRSKESLDGDAEYKQVDGIPPTKKGGPLGHRRRRGSIVSRHSGGGSSLALSSMDIPGIAALTAGAGDNEDAPRDTAADFSLLKTLGRVWRSTLADLGVLRSPEAIIIAVTFSFCVNGYITFVMMVPFAMEADGFTLQDSAICISISAVCNFMMRITASFLSDWHRFNVRHCYRAAVLLISVSTFAFPLAPDLLWMKVAMGAWGAGVGAKMSLYNLVIINVVGIDRLPAMVGSTGLATAIGFIVIGPLIGVVRDKTRSYLISMWLLAVLVFFSFCLWLILPAPKDIGGTTTRTRPNMSSEEA
ncbi:monocarboxylate transporter 9-like isoform X2 [Penaeus japonicus]|uniref:monocarboxylate transporter 9-like isoform X2 n=1 Tax=Penaeus japonicus TaxID=27405 RepID=UPI001C7150A6|nr:monocarboxylate transporter 9-like isoform X2 [Penaeus japonicus]